MRLLPPPLATCVAAVGFVVGVPGATAAAGVAAAPQTVLWDGDALLQTRAALWAGTAAPALSAAATTLHDEAGSAVGRGPFSVTNKTVVPPTGATPSKHYYMSIGAYWWPCVTDCNASLFPNCAAWTHSDLGPPGPPYANCSNATGLPWYDHDGYANPVNAGLDGPRLGALVDAVETLALSDFFLNSTAHGARAASLLSVWFLDNATSMLPSGAFAQGIPGRCDGRGIGLIDFASSFPRLLDAAALLRFSGAPGWGAAESAALRAWMAEWLDYLIDSPNGRDEAAALNNHGSNFDVHAAAVALHVGNVSVAHALCADAGPKRVAVQVAANGTLPLEDSRTKSEEYHLFDTMALLRLATLCDPVLSQSSSTAPSSGAAAAPSLFSYVAPNNGSLAAVVDWLRPFAARPPAAEWPFLQIRPVPDAPLQFGTVFRLAANARPWAVDAAAREAVAAAQLRATNGSDWLVQLTLPFTNDRDGGPAQ